MSMNIKNEQAHKLARKLAKITGENITAAVTESLRERLDRIENAQGEGLADRLLKIGKDCAARLQEPFRTADHADLLYNDKGLPR